MPISHIINRLRLVALLLICFYYSPAQDLTPSSYSKQPNRLQSQNPARSSVASEYCEINGSFEKIYASLYKVSLGNINYQNPNCSGPNYEFVNQTTQVFPGQTLLLTVGFGQCRVNSTYYLSGAVYIDWNNNKSFLDPGERVVHEDSIYEGKLTQTAVTVPSYVTPGDTIRMRISTLDHAIHYPYTAVLPCGYTTEARDFNLLVKVPVLGGKPSSLSSKDPNSRALTIRWQDNSANETGYLIERSLDSVNFLSVGSLPPNTISFRDTLLEPDRRYFYRISPLPVQADSFSIVGASSLSTHFNLTTRNESQPAEIDYRQGIYWGDVNNDLKPDFYSPNSKYYFINSDTGFVRKPLSGSGVFAGWVDYDNDGDQDLFTPAYLDDTTFIKAVVLENDGLGNLSKKDLMLPWEGNSSNTFAWSDYNKDGLLDLLICYSGSGTAKLFRNAGDKSFSLVQSFESVGGIPSFVDYDSDGDDDLIFLDDWYPIAFKLSDTSFSVDENAQLPMPLHIRSVSWADYDNDGDIDVFASSEDTDQSYLYKNNGNGIFAELPFAALDGFKNCQGSSWSDIDNDGFQDLVVTRGLYVTKVIRNNGTDLVELPQSIFASENYNAGAIYDNAMLWSSTAFSDWNSDGFTDFIVNKRNQSWLFTNVGNNNKWINFHLTGFQSNKNAVGARIQIKVNNEWQYRWLHTSSGLRGQTDYIVRFGCGSNSVVDSAVIRWPSGEVTHLSSLPTNQLHLIAEPVSQIFIFTGTVDNSWHNASNWSSGQVPNSNSNVVIPAGKTCVINSPANCRSLTIATGGTLQNASDLNIKFPN